MADPNSLPLQGQESPVQGPRIKHVCRHASVALGQSRAMVPEDVPRLSALPLREREEIAASPTVEGEWLCGDASLKHSFLYAPWLLFKG